MNKRYWNTIVLDGSVPCGEVAELLDLFYTLVVKRDFVRRNEASPRDGWLQKTLELLFGKRKLFFRGSIRRASY